MTKNFERLMKSNLCNFNCCTYSNLYNDSNVAHLRIRELEAKNNILQENANQEKLKLQNEIEEIKKVSNFLLLILNNDTIPETFKIIYVYALSTGGQQSH